MAEVIKIPKVGGEQSSLTREKSSLDGNVGREKPAIQKMELSGSVNMKKPTFIHKLRDTFIADDARDVGDYILWDILIPTIKRTIRDIIVGSADRVFLGTGTAPSGSSLYRERGVTYVKSQTNYSTISSKKKPSLTSPKQNPRINFRLDEIVFENYEDASSVLERMVDYLDTYGQVSVDAYFDLIGKTSPYTTQNWGWTSLASATIVTTVGGYFIKLPNPVVIER